MSFGKLSHTMVYQPFNPQTTSTPNSDPTGLFAQYAGQPNFGYSLPPMPLPPYPFQGGAMMMNPMCAPTVQQHQQQQPINVSSSGADPAQLANGARRKNATRETTATLKAWLYEHRKNPYPTKGEKIMLAIITRMSLNQVSTWFANARRRLKKENKIGGSPKDLDDSDSDDLINKTKKNSANKVSGSTSSDNMNMDDLDDLDDMNEDVSDDDDDNNHSFSKDAKHHTQSVPSVYPNFNLNNKFSSMIGTYPQFPLFKPQVTLSQSTSATTTEKRDEPTAKKPKIWSIADVATKPSPPSQKSISPGKPLNVNLSSSSSSSSSSSCPSPMKNEQFLAAFSAVINQQSQPLSVPASSSPSSTTSTLSNISNESANFVNYQQLYYQHLTSQFTNEFLRHSFLQQQQQQQHHLQIQQQQNQLNIQTSQSVKTNEISNEQNVNSASKDEHECQEQEQRDELKSTSKRELDEDESNLSFESDGSNAKKLKSSHESDLSSSSLSQSSPSSKRKLDDSI